MKTLGTTLFLFVALVFLSKAQSLTEPSIPSCCSANSQTCSMKSSIGAMCKQSCALKNYNSNAVVEMKEAQPGDLTICPVSGAVFKVVETSAFIEVEGKKYFTCCSTCAALAKEHPNLIDIEKL